MKIISGPNLQFYLVTAFVCYWSYDIHSFWPIVLWIIFCIVLIPASILFHKWSHDDKAN